jgi:hypothetical protein
VFKQLANYSTYSTLEFVPVIHMHSDVLVSLYLVFWLPLNYLLSTTHSPSSLPGPFPSGPPALSLSPLYLALRPWEKKWAGFSWRVSVMSGSVRALHSVWRE